MSTRRSSRTAAVANAAANGPTLSSRAGDTEKAKRRVNKRKASNGTNPTESTSETKAAQALAMPPPPSTPKKKAKTMEAATSPDGPKTPVPAKDGEDVPDNVAEVAAAGASARKRRVRPAGAHITNATLQTPRGSTLVAVPEISSAPSTPSKLSREGSAMTTTENLLEKACAHLVKMDPNLAPVIAKFPCSVFSPEGLAEKTDPFAALVRGICAQQVSGAAAKSILNKFIALYHDEKAVNAASEAKTELPFPMAQQVAATDLARLRTAGLSGRKAEYIQGLAQKFADGELTAQMLLTASDEEILEKLTAVRGLGKWSVEMFAIFTLKRTDILSTGDLGVQRGMAAYVGKDVSKLKAKGGGNKWKYMSEQDMLSISEKFTPYRSLFMWYMWRIEDVDIDVMGSSVK